MQTKELRAQRAKTIIQAQELLKGENVTPEILAQVDAMFASAEMDKKQIDSMENADRLVAELNEQAGVRAEVKHISVDQQLDAVAQEKRIITAHLRGNRAVAQLSASDRAVYEQRRNAEIQAALATNVPTGAGLLIAPEWSGQLLVNAKAQGGMRAAADVITTDTGASLPFLTMDDTANQATIIAENTQITEDVYPTMGSATLNAWTWKSGVLLVSFQMLNDSYFDLDNIIGTAITNRFVRAQNAKFTSGSGTNEPQGVLNGASLGVTAPNGNTTSMPYLSLVGLEHSIDPVLRSGAVYMVHDKTLLAFKSLLDSQNRPLFAPGIQQGAYDTMNGYPIVINQDLPVPAANAKSVLFGNFKQYKIRDVKGMQLMVLRERYADFLQIGYIAFMRSDGRLVSAGAPVKWAANSAT